MHHFIESRELEDSILFNFIERTMTDTETSRSHSNICKKYATLTFFLFIFFPMFPMIVATVFGGLFFLCEPETTFRQGFLYTVANLLGINPLNDYTPTKLATAAIIDTYVAVTSLVFFGIMLNVVNLFEIPLDLNHAIERKITKNKIAIPIIALCIVIPTWNISLSALFGFVLAGIEKWPISDGFLYVFSNALYLGNPLTDVSPNTPSGALLDVLISSMAVGYMAIFADYVTTLNPAKFVRKRLRKYFGEAGIIDIETSPELYPNAGHNITSGADNLDVNETIIHTTSDD